MIDEIDYWKRKLTWLDGLLLDAVYAKLADEVDAAWVLSCQTERKRVEEKILDIESKQGSSSLASAQSPGAD